MSNPNLKYIYIGLTVISCYYLSKRFFSKNINFTPVDINAIIKEKEEEKIYRRINYENEIKNGFQNK